MPYRTTKRGEVQQLQYEVGHEITRDAPEIAKGVFGDNALHPDMASVSNEELDNLYRQKYLSNDRTWLQAEARRDPEQFLKVVQRIGVALPPSDRVDGAPPPVPDPNALGKVLQNAAAAPPPIAPPAMVQPGVGVPASPAVAPMPAALPPQGPVAPTVPTVVQPPLPGMP